jgi:hypothetical protein
MPLQYTLPDSRVLSAGTPFILGDVQYPANWLELATPGDLTERGITVTEVPDPEPAPITVVSMFQARAALMQAGLFDAVDSYLKAAGGVHLQAWEYATEVRKDSALVQSMAAHLQLDEAQVTTLFNLASTITI